MPGMDEQKRRRISNFCPHVIGLTVLLYTTIKRLHAKHG
jgi:hypothetical protein